MRIAVYARVSTQRQAQMQTIEQQLERLQAHFQLQGWEWRDELVFRDDGYTGSTLKRPGLDRLGVVSRKLFNHCTKYNVNADRKRIEL